MLAAIRQPALKNSLWHAHQLDAQPADSVPSQFTALDRQLPGAGWPLSNLIELLADQPGIGEMRLLAPVLAALTRNAQTVLLVTPPAMPYAPALAAQGVALDQLIVVDAPGRADRLWTIEQALKSASLGALVAWLPEESGVLVPIDQLRRLQLAAQASGALAFILRPLAARDLASPAALRIALAAAPCSQLTLDIFKRRGAPLAAPLTIALPSPVPAPERRMPESLPESFSEPLPESLLAAQAKAEPEPDNRLPITAVAGDLAA